MKIIDAHIHIFSKIDGQNEHGTVKGCGYGKILNEGIESPFMPPFTDETRFTAEMLREVMDQNGVEKAVLFQNPTIGSVNEEIAQAIRKYPERFTGVLQIDPFADDAMAQMEHLIAQGVFSAIKFELSTGWGWTGVHKDREFHYSMMNPFVELAKEHNLSVVFDTGDTFSRAYLPEELGLLADCFPEVTFVIEHGGYLTPDGDLKKWEAMTDIAERKNVYLGICAVCSLIEDEYPCQKGNEILRKLYRKVGVDKLVWGTDAPCTLKLYTYRQMIDAVRVHADFLSGEDLEKIFYSNAEKIYFRN